MPSQLWARPYLLATDESCCSSWQGGFSLFLHFHNVSLVFTFPLLSSWPQFRTACKHMFNLIDLVALHVRRKTQVPLPIACFMYFTLKRHEVEVRSGRSRVDWSVGFPLVSTETPNSQAGDSCRCFLSGVYVSPGKPQLF